MRRSPLIPLSAFLAFALAGTASAAPVTWVVDPAHTEVSFKVRHLVISKVRGEFKDFKGTIVLDDENLKNNKITGEIQVASIDTGNEKRDGHLKSADFFLAEKHPTITFESTAWKKSGAGYDIFGKLTMRGVTKPVQLRLEGPSQVVKDPYGGSHRGLSMTGKINRQDWGLAWSKTVEGTGAVVSDEVELEIDVELMQPPK